MQLTPEQYRRAFGLAEAAKRIRGRFGRPASVATLRRYADPSVGYKPSGWTGEPLVLMTVRLGQDYVTLPEWVERFERERSDMGTMVRPRVKFKNRRPRAASVRRANERLDAAGVK